MRPSIRSIMEAERPLVTPLAHDAPVGTPDRARPAFALSPWADRRCWPHVMPYPDIGLIGLTDMAAGLADMAAATDLPFLADADDGYGDAKAVARLVETYERIGVGGFLLEDQDRDRKQQRADHGGSVVDLPVIEGKPPHGPGGAAEPGDLRDRSH